jgi:mRNA interferase MazF
VKQVFPVPGRGDVVRVTLAPRGGSRTRPARCAAVVLSPQAYNAKVGRAILCPVTARVKGYPFEVAIPHGQPVEGAILADRAESIDWRAARAERICSLPDALIEEALGKFRALIG